MNCCVSNEDFTHTTLSAKRHVHQLVSSKGVGFARRNYEVEPSVQVHECVPGAAGVHDQPAVDGAGGGGSGTGGAPTPSVARVRCHRGRLRWTASAHPNHDTAHLLFTLAFAFPNCLRWTLPVPEKYAMCSYV